MKQLSFDYTKPKEYRVRYTTCDVRHVDGVLKVLEPRTRVTAGAMDEDGAMNFIKHLEIYLRHYKGDAVLIKI